MKISCPKKDYPRMDKESQTKNKKPSIPQDRSKG